MPQIQSAKKALRVSKRRQSINTRNKNAYKDLRKAITEALTKGDVKGAKKLLPEAYQKFDYAAKKGAIHKNTASRYKSNMAQAVKRADLAAK